MNQHGANDIVDRTNDMLSLTVLGGRVRARHTKVDVMGEEERVGCWNCQIRGCCHTELP